MGSPRQQQKKQNQIIKSYRTSSNSLQVEVLNNLKLARFKLIVSTNWYDSQDKYHTENQDITGKVISCWLDPVKNRICKLHGILDKKPNNQEFAAHCLQVTNLNVGHGSVKVDRKLQAFRFGSNEPVFKTSDQNYETLYIYNSKSDVIRNILSGNQQLTIGGTELVNLNVVPDQLLVDLGFTLVPDICGLGQPMWLGDVNKILKANAQGSRYGYGYSNDYNSKVTENLESFVKLITEAVSV